MFWYILLLTIAVSVFDLRKMKKEKFTKEIIVYISIAVFILVLSYFYSKNMYQLSLWKLLSFLDK